jgi:AraC-like DNA-binding protein
MDVLTDLLHRARARNALVRQLVQRPPWGMTFADSPSLTVAATLGGHAWIRLGDSTPVRLAADDIALITGPGGYTITDEPGTAPRFLIRDGRKHLPDGTPVALPAALAPRTYGDGLAGATTVLRGAYHLHGFSASRLLALLPPLAVVPSSPRPGPALDLLATATTRDEPGQDAVLARLLDLLLVIALRAWCTGPQASPPAWYRALTDPPVGEALRLMHGDPAYHWTVASLAAKVGLSRSAFAQRFTSLVGQPPLGYLTGWRMTIAADLLRDTQRTVAAVACQVGYRDPVAFSVAFKRAHGHTPSAWRDLS